MRDLIAIVHYHEIGLKGRNRAHFEQILTSRIHEALADLKAKVSRRPGRIVVTGLASSDRDRVRARLQKVFGIAYIAFATLAPIDFDAIAERALEHLPPGAKTFRVRAKRSDKRLPFTSIEAEREVGARVKRLTGLGVDLTQPDVTVHLELTQDDAWVYTSATRFPGPGGLPVGASGKVVALISGGIDSPVAAWRVMKRGAKAIFVHFHSHPHTDFASAVKAKREVEVLAAWQGARSSISFPWPWCKPKSSPRPRNATVPCSTGDSCTASPKKSPGAKGQGRWSAAMPWGRWRVRPWRTCTR